MANPHNNDNKMRENNPGTFTLPYGQVDDTHNPVAYPMANWGKKFRGKMAKEQVEHLAIEPVIDSHVLTLIRRMMGSQADKFDAAFSVRHALTDAAFNAYLHRQANRKTLALWQGNFSKDEYLAIYEVHVGGQLDFIEQQPKHIRFNADLLEGSDVHRSTTTGSRPGMNLSTNEFNIDNPAQCTVRYIVRIKA